MQTKKLTAFIALFLCVIMLFTSCNKKGGNGAVTPGSSYNTTSGTLFGGGATSNNPLAVQKPAFAQGAVFWNATSFNGILEVDSEYTIVVENGNSGVSALATTLSRQLKSLYGSNIFQTTDDSAPVAKEILLGATSGRNEYYEAELIFSRYMQYASNAIGCFYIGVENGKLIVFGATEADYIAAAQFILNNYINGKEAFLFEGDLSSMYIYDKAVFNNNKTFAYISADSLEGDASLSGITVNGAPVGNFNASVLNYTTTIFLDDEFPTIAASAVNGNAQVQIAQPTTANGGVASVSVTSANGKVTNTYTLAVQRLDYNLASATLHPYRNGAKGAVSFIQDDAFQSATENMLSVCVPNDIKFSIGVIAKKAGTLNKGTDGKYIIDENGNFDITLVGENSGWSGGGSLFYYRNVLAQHANIVDIISHSYTHTSWGLTDMNNVAAEIVGSKQLLQAAFPGQKVESFVYPGFDDKGTRSQEYALAREQFMPGVYVAARSLTTAKLNELSKNVYDLGACSFYNNQDVANWNNSSLSTQHSWMLKEIKTVASRGGWVVTMNHDIRDVDPTDLSNGNMTSTKQQFKYIVEDVVVPLRDEGILWVDWVSVVGKYVSEYKAATFQARSFADGHYEIVLTDTLDDELYNEALTVDVDVPYDWTSATVSYKDAEGNVISSEVVSVSNRVIRLQIVPDSGIVHIVKN